MCVCLSIYMAVSRLFRKKGLGVAVTVGVKRAFILGVAAVAAAAAAAVVASARGDPGGGI